MKTKRKIIYSEMNVRGHYENVFPEGFINMRWVGMSLGLVNTFTLVIKTVKSVAS